MSHTEVHNNYMLLAPTENKINPFLETNNQTALSLVLKDWRLDGAIPSPIIISRTDRCQESFTLPWSPFPLLKKLGEQDKPIPSSEFF